jgi:hypothetical protein
MSSFSSWTVTSAPVDDAAPSTPSPPLVFASLAEAKRHLCQELKCTVADLPQYKRGASPGDAGMYVQAVREDDDEDENENEDVEGARRMYALFELIRF